MKKHLHLIERLCMLFPLTFMILAFASLGMNAWGQTVTTDKDDYAPGEWVIITGTGWEGDDQVKLTIIHAVFTEHPTEVFYADVDGDGNFFFDQYQIDEWDIGETFELTATGMQTGRMASTTFTDGNVSVKSGGPGYTVSVSYTHYGSTGCVGSVLGSGAITGIGPGGQVLANVLSTQSITITAGELSSAGGAFLNWTGASTASTRTICLTGDNGALNLWANYVTCTPPAALVLTGSAVCAGVTTAITSTTSVIDVSYQLYNSSNAVVGVAQAGTGSGLTWSGVPAGTGYYVIGTLSPGCASTSNLVNVLVNPLPAALELTGDEVCEGETTSITSSTSELGVSYQLFNDNDDAVGSSVPGTGSGLAWTSVAAGTGYYVVGTNDDTDCESTSNEVGVIVNPLPAALVLTGDEVCEGETTSITSSTSEIGVSYQLFNDNDDAVGSSVPGTGSGLTWTSVDAGTGYYVVGTNDDTDCESTSNEVDVIVNPLPVALVLSGDEVCEGETTSITSLTSEIGVSYQLFDDNDDAVGSSVVGTGLGLTWTPVAEGTGYYVVGTNDDTDCESTSNEVDVIVNPLPAALVLTGDEVCEGETTSITSLTSELGVSYQLFNDNDDAVGSSVPGTGSGLAWTSVAAGTGYYVVGTNDDTDCESTSNDVDVIVNLLPVISCPTNIEDIENDEGLCSGSVTFAATTTAGTEPITIAYYLDYDGDDEEEISSTYSFPVGITTVTAVATNDCGSDDCEFTVEVIDTENPVITTCPEPEESYATDAGLCTKELSFEAEATDNCPDVEIAYYLDYEGANKAEILFPYDFPFGTTTVTVVASDLAGNTDKCTFDVVVDHVTTILAVTVDPVSQQYTDMVTLTATLTPWDCELVDCTADGEVEFTIGNQVMGKADLIDGVAELEVQLCGDFNVAGTLGTFDVSAVYTPDVCDVYLGSDDVCEDCLEIVPEVACAVYSGVYYASTGSINSTTATVVLAATVISDDDGDYCDITNAKVQFLVNENVLATVPVELLVGEIGDGPSIGTASYEWKGVSVGTYDIRVKIVGGYYTNDTEGDCDGEAIVVVGMPSPDFITGGGYVIMENSKGLYAGTTGLKNNFGFNVKYNRKMTNLQGNINTIVRRMENDGLHIYQVKGNVMSSLTVNGNSAVFTGKANIQDITDPDNPISIAGNCNMQFTMTDNGEPGTADMISVTVWKSDGGMWFTTNWADNKPAEQMLDGGNLVVHSAKSEPVVSEPSTPPGKKKSAEIVDTNVQFGHFAVYPNPFSERVRFEFVSAEASQARIDMLDITGRLVKTVFNQPVEAGVLYNAEFKPDGEVSSFYIYRMILGESVQTGKMIYRK